MKNAIILMTALVPTTGHSDLIEFAQHLPNTKVHVLVNSRSFEPLDGGLRVEALQNAVFNKDLNNVVICESLNDTAPQNPEDMLEGFWEWWKNEINTNFPEVKQWDYVVASEHYGKNIADILGAEFIPYDIERVHNNTKGTFVRQNIWENWINILPVVRREFQYRAVLFGQESVGKTTLSKSVSESLGVPWLVEYARPYLHEVGEDLSMQKMSNIHAGQKSLQEMFFTKASAPAIILDTDLFSTVGYYRIMGEKVPEELINDALRLNADMYFVLPDDIPLVKDPQRYGGDKRESDTQFWIDLLEEFDQPYTIVPSGSVEEKTAWIADCIRNGAEAKTKSVREFVREW